MPEGWSADHLLLAALVRCSIDSFAYHARRSGHETAASGSAHGTITKSGDDGRYRFVEIDVRLDVQLTPRTNEPGRPDREGRARLLRRRVADRQAPVHMARVLTTVESVRERFSALQRPLAFFDGPGGTQVPDSVIDAIAGYLRDANANLGGAFETSRELGRAGRAARETAAEFLNATRRRGRVRREHDDAQLRPLAHGGARVAGGRRGRSARSSTTTANVSPWLELAHDKGLVVNFAEVDDECRLDLDHLRSLLSDHARGRVSMGVERGRDDDTRRRDRRAGARRRCARLGSTPCTTDRTGRSTCRQRVSTCCSARPTSSTARIWALRTSGELEAWRPARFGRPTTSRSGTASRRDGTRLVVLPLRRRVERRQGAGLGPGPAGTVGGVPRAAAHLRSRDEAGHGNWYNNLLDYVISAALIFYILTIAGIFRLRQTRPDADWPYRAVSATP